MLRRYASTALLTGSLIFGSLTAFTPSTLQANGVGVFATVTAIDTRGVATLLTEGGETFTTTRETRWKVGTRLQCERVTGLSAYVERCLLWQ